MASCPADQPEILYPPNAPKKEANAEFVLPEGATMEWENKPKPSYAPDVSIDSVLYENVKCQELILNISVIS